MTTVRVASSQAYARVQRRPEPAGEAQKGAPRDQAEVCFQTAINSC